jgi:hypothetical protein
MANQKVLASDDGRITTNSLGVKILTYRAIPHPIAESWQKQLMSVRKTHKTDAERVASVIRIEAQIRSLFGVEVSREYRGER